MQTFLKRPSGLLRIPGNAHLIYRPNYLGGSKPCVGSTLLSHARLIFSATNFRSLATLNGPHQVHSATTMHRLDTQQSRGKNSWTKHFPDVHNIQAKNTDKDAVWGKRFEAIITVHRGKDRRARRVWTTFPEGSQGKKALRVKWPEDEQADVQRKLRDASEKWFDDPKNDEVFFMVTEKVGVDGRLFWREVIPEGESTEEEEHLSWEEMMEEEGFNAHIERLMRKAL